MKAALAVACSLLAVVVAAGEAAAASSHERAAATPITKGGVVVGMRVKLTLRPDHSESNHKVVRVGIAPVSTSEPSNHRLKASDPAQGYLIHQWPEISIPDTSGTPIEQTLEVLYADVPGLKPGTEVELISAWNDPANPTYWHVWGMQGVTADRGSVLPVPAVDAAPPAGARAAGSVARTLRQAHRRTSRLLHSARRPLMSRGAKRRR